MDQCVWQPCTSAIDILNVASRQKKRDRLLTIQRTYRNVAPNQFIGTFSMFFTVFDRRLSTARLIVHTRRAWVLHLVSAYLSPDDASVHTYFAMYNTHSNVENDSCNTFCCQEFDHRTLI